MSRLTVEVRPSPVQLFGRSVRRSVYTRSTGRSVYIPEKFCLDFVAADGSRRGGIAVEVCLLFYTRVGKAVGKAGYCRYRRRQLRVVESPQFGPAVEGTVVQGDPFLEAYLLPPVARGRRIGYVGSQQISGGVAGGTSPAGDGGGDGMIERGFAGAPGICPFCHGRSPGARALAAGR